MTKDPKYDQFGGTGVIVAHTIWRLAKVVGACVMIHLGLSKNDTYPGICCLPLISKMAMEIHQKSTFFRWFLSILSKFSIFFLNFSNLFPYFPMEMMVIYHDFPWKARTTSFPPSWHGVGIQAASRCFAPCWVERSPPSVRGWCPLRTATRNPGAFLYGYGSIPCTPVVHIKIAGIYGCESP